MKNRWWWTGVLLLALVSQLAGEEAKPENTAENLVTLSNAGVPASTNIQEQKPDEVNLSKYDVKDLTSYGENPPINSLSVLFSLLGGPIMRVPNTCFSPLGWFSTVGISLETSLNKRQNWTILFPINVHVSSHQYTGSYLYDDTVIDGDYYIASALRVLVLTGVDTRYYCTGNRVRGGLWLEAGFRVGYIYIYSKKVHMTTSSLVTDLDFPFGTFLDFGLGQRYKMKNLIIEPFFKYYFLPKNPLGSTISLGVNLGYDKISLDEGNKTIIDKIFQRQEIGTFLINPFGVIFSIEGFNYQNFLSTLSSMGFLWEWNLIPAKKLSLLVGGNGFFEASSGNQAYMWGIFSEISMRYYLKNLFKTGLWGGMGVKIGYIEEIDNYYNPSAESYVGLGCFGSFQAGLRICLRDILLEPFVAYDLSMNQINLSQGWIGMNIGFYRWKPVLGNRELPPEDPGLEDRDSTQKIPEEPKRGEFYRSVLMNPMGIIGMSEGDNYTGFWSLLSLLSIEWEWTWKKSRMWTFLFGISVRDQHNLGNTPDTLITVTSYNVSVAGRCYYNKDFTKNGMWSGLGVKLGYITNSVSGVQNNGFNVDISVQTGYRFHLWNMIVEPFVAYDLSCFDVKFSRLWIGFNMGYYQARQEWSEEELKDGTQKRKQFAGERNHRAVLINPVGLVGAFMPDNYTGFASLLSFSSVEWEWKLGYSGKWTILFGAGMRLQQNDYDTPASLMSVASFCGNLTGRYYYSSHFAQNSVWSGLGIKPGYIFVWNGEERNEGFNVDVSFQSGIRFRLRNMIVEPFVAYDLTCFNVKNSYLWIGLNLGYYRSKIRKQTSSER